MAHTPLRFVHVGPLRLDAPLRGTGRLPADLRRLAEDATLIAWERVVDACLEYSADFLLLSGTALDQPATLRARRAFIEGCAALDEFDIAVFVDDPQLTREKFADFRLPENVHILDGLTAASWSRPQRLSVRFALVRSGAPALVDPAADADAEPEVFTIALAVDSHEGEPVSHFNYVAMRSETPHHSTDESGCVLHAPGSAQGLCGGHAGPHGCSVVEVDAERRVDVTPLPTAAVRWEQFVLQLEGTTSRDQLVEQMQLGLLDREASVGERLWIVEWRFAGVGPVFDGLSDDLTFRELCSAVESGLGGKAGPERVHRRDLFDERNETEDALVRELVEALDDAGPVQEFGVLQQIIQGQASARLCAGDDSGLRAHAVKLARRWLADEDERQRPS
jgi:hypothetical protein